MHSRPRVHAIRHPRLLAGLIAISLTAAALVAPPAHAEGEVDSDMVTLSDAERVFGVSDSNGDNELDAPYLKFSLDSQSTYVPVFTEQASKKDSIESAASTQGVQGAGDEAVEVVYSRYTEDQVEAAIVEIEEVAMAKDLTISFDYNPAVDAIEVEATRASSPFLPEEAEGVEIVVNEQEDENLASYDSYNDYYASPFYGSMYALGAAGNDPNTSADCTLGIPAYNANGTPGVFTAGHCFQFDSPVYTGATSASQYRVGNVTHDYTYPEPGETISKVRDAQFISGGTEYRPFIITGYSRAEAKVVTGSYYAGIGDRVCFNGATSGRKCGNQVLSYDYRRCNAGVCSENNMRMGGPQDQGADFGDSGAAMYVNFGDAVKVSGILSGAAGVVNGDLTFAAQEWRSIRPSYDATSMTG